MQDDDSAGNTSHTYVSLLWNDEIMRQTAHEMNDKTMRRRKKS
jgi:hypothetical protein